MISGKAIEQLNSLDGYRQSFMDVSLWRPYIESICSRYFQVPCRVIRSGLPGTHPTFIVDDRWVVKLFGCLFDGVLTFDTEKQVDRFLVHDYFNPAPKIIASGTLFEDSECWPWLYHIYEFFPSVTISEVYLINWTEFLATLS